ncbi:MAG TPA: alpha/beta fold hydrolase, partial [Anaeromyxobacteraceae bacterium]|nr:alpha/beta fold hydrolase [Anaeromyxobacteraceae bacterium]
EALPALGKRVVALGLLSATPCFTSRRDWPHGLPEPSVRALLARLAHRPEKALQRFFGAMFQPGEIDEKRRAEIEERTAHSPPALAPLRAALEALIAADQRSRLREVKVPTLLIHGECDPICLPGASSFAASHIRGARRLLLPGVGHAPQLSRPELVNELLLRFLSEAW